MPKLQPNLLLNYSEYVDTWSDLLIEFYSRCITDDLIVETLHLSHDDMPNYTVNLSTIIVSLGMLVLERNGTIPVKIIQKLQDKIAVDFCGQVFNNTTSEFVETWINHYKFHSRILKQAVKESSKGNDDRLPELVGFARIILKDVNIAEKQKVSAIEKITLVLFDATTSFKSLAANTGMAYKIIGQPKFIVRKA